MLFCFIFIIFLLITNTGNVFGHLNLLLFKSFLFCWKQIIYLYTHFYHIMVQYLQSQSTFTTYIFNNKLFKRYLFQNQVKIEMCLSYKQHLFKC